MADTEPDKEYQIDHGNGVISTVKAHPSGHIITTDHNVKDADGNPKISVHVQTDRSQIPYPAVEPPEGIKGQQLAKAGE
jgi:hypothetical protein